MTKETDKREILEICRSFAPKLLTFVELNYPALEEDSDDVVQSVLEKILRRYRLYDSQYSISTWIYSLARNHCIDLLRRQSRRKKRITAVEDAEALISNHPSPEQAAFDKEDAARLRSIYRRLPPRERQVIWLSIYEEMTFREIGLVMDIPAGTAKYLKHRAKERIRLLWEEKQ